VDARHEAGHDDYGLARLRLKSAYGKDRGVSSQIILAVTGAAVAQW
jgi:hypothetical protein